MVTAPCSTRQSRHSRASPGSSSSPAIQKNPPTIVTPRRCGGSHSSSPAGGEGGMVGAKDREHPAPWSILHSRPSCGLEHPQPGASTAWTILSPQAPLDVPKPLWMSPSLTCHVEGEEGSCQRCPEEQPRHQDHEEVPSQGHAEPHGHSQSQGQQEGGTAAEPAGMGCERGWALSPLPTGVTWAPPLPVTGQASGDTAQCPAQQVCGLLQGHLPA